MDSEHQNIERNSVAERSTTIVQVASDFIRSEKKITEAIVFKA